MLTYPGAQVDREDGYFPLLQEENDHEGEGVRGNTTFSLAVNVTQLQNKHRKRKLTASFPWSKLWICCITQFFKMWGKQNICELQTENKAKQGETDKMSSFFSDSVLPYPCPVAECQYQWNQSGLQFSQGCQVISGKTGNIIACSHFAHQATAQKWDFRIVSPLKTNLVPDVPVQLLLYLNNTCKKNITKHLSDWT